MGRAGKNTHRHMLNTGRKDIQNTMPEKKDKTKTYDPPQMKGKSAPLVKYANHPHVK